jgi:hypothetical protein
VLLVAPCHTDAADGTENDQLHHLGRDESHAVVADDDTVAPVAAVGYDGADSAAEDYAAAVAEEEHEDADFVAAASWFLE